MKSKIALGLAGLIAVGFAATAAAPVAEAGVGATNAASLVDTTVMVTANSTFSK